MNKKKVIVLGGGVSGMTAAHELIERDFEVTIFEYKTIPGGKARSMPALGTGLDGRQDLPGEHGFRLFPGFYRHVTDTLKRIPYRDNLDGVYGNLVNATRTGAARFDYPLVEMLNDLPHSISDFKALFKAAFFGNFGLTEEDMDLASSKFWQILSSCKKRRLAEYQNITWWEFIEAEGRSQAYEDFFASITRFTVAAKAKKANTRTIGNVATALLLDILTPGVSDDRVLNGPTNDVWVNPWLEHLRNMGVDYRMGAEIKSIECNDGRISGVYISQEGRAPFKHEADFYVCALPIEVIAGLLNDELIQADPTLYYLTQLKDHVDWMNGIQYYLTEDVAINHGHTVYIQSPWALTSISQPQFWPHTDLAKYGDGTVQGIISVDVSDWFTPGLNGKRAVDCTADEIKWEVWNQLKKSLNHEGREILRDDMLHGYFIDSDIQFVNPHKTINLEPLLVNNVGTYELRPDAVTAIPNLFLAGDYVRTDTDLATMEGANEAARRAVNGLLDASESEQARAELWDMYEPLVLAPWRAHDKRRFEKGLPWDGELL